MYCMLCLEDGLHAGHRMSRIVRVKEEKLGEWRTIKEDARGLVSLATARYSEISGLILSLDQMKQDSQSSIKQDMENL